MPDLVELRPVSGACHCRNISFTLRFPVTESPTRVRACSCSFCLKHGGIYTSHPEAKLQVLIADEDQLQRYRFGTNTAHFLICRRRGAVPVITSHIDDTCYAVVNVNTLDNIDRAEFEEATTNFEGEASGGGIPRDRLKQLLELVEQRRNTFRDPRLVELLDDIELRAKVELAKLGEL